MIMTSTRLAVAMLAGLASATGALAHALLDHAAPAVGSTVREPPAEVRLWFTQEIEPAFSKVQVFDKNGAEVDRKDNQVDHADAMLLKVSLSPLAPGVYRVRWRILSVDEHVTKGDFTFDVVP